jgi:hypothetical protein
MCNIVLYIKEYKIKIYFKVSTLYFLFYFILFYLDSLDKLTTDDD